MWYVSEVPGAAAIFPTTVQPVIYPTTMQQPMTFPTLTQPVTYLTSPSYVTTTPSGSVTPSTFLDLGLTSCYLLKLCMALLTAE